MVMRQAASPQQAKDFWEACHKDSVLSALTGANYEQTIHFMRVKPFFKPGIAVLEAGIGIGDVSRGLWEAGMRPSAMDISQNALDKVDDYCEGTYLVEDLERIPTDYFDIVICCNMVQHVPTELLLEELKHFWRSLKDDGVFAIQFVSNDTYPDMGAMAPLNRVKAGTLCRSPEYMRQVFDNLGGVCEPKITTAGLKKGVVNGNHVFHVTKRRGAK
jgi:2-polyprenyl-3-methyl-5-hydroxy-6-metoxy-1,4-benzoquinol methylase